ncbi:MAG: hypothetical protein M1828_002410 [Chrysothrix sp. TS-e1954]|nr:MAG: hypothetical protein M1828_002410 [Chrysothrix sp. TS-e1954]
MSAIGISPGDLVKALQFCRWIYDHCFDQANTAVPRYRQFVRDIYGLEKTLESLKKQVTFQQQNLGLYLDPFSTDSQAGAKRDFLEVVGDYEATLKECCNLLRTHDSIDRDGAGIIQNIRWGSSIQGKVDSLQRRIQCHNGKINLLLEPFRNSQLQGIETTVLAVLELLDPPPDLPYSIIPVAVDEKFQDALQHSLTARATDFSRVTRREKLDSLYRIWQASTGNGSAPSGNAIEQQLNLLKSAWLIKRLRLDDSFKTARRGLPYRRTILEVQRLVARALGQVDEQLYSRDEFFSLDPLAFRIIQADLPDIASPADDDRPLETKLLELPLLDIQGCISHSLMVFRSGPEALRIEEGITSNDRIKVRESCFDFRSDILLPYYAVPTEGTSLTLVLRNRAGSRKTPYQLKEAKDLFDIQRAITGYEVLSNFDKVTFTAHKTARLLGRQDMHGPSRLQMWRWRPLTSDRRMSSVSSVSSNGQVASKTSQSTNSTWQNVVQSLHPSLMDGPFVSLIDEQDGKNSVIATRAPYPPILILFTKLDEALCFVAFDLTHEMYKKDSACECRSNPAVCSRTVLCSRNNSFLARKFSTSDSSLPGAHLDRWDLSVFGRPAAEKPEFHPDYTSKAMQKVNIKYLALDFPSVEDRVKFDEQMNTVAFMRNDEESKLQDFYNLASTMQGQPRSAIAPTSPKSADTASCNSSQSTIPASSTIFDLHAPQVDVDLAAWRTAGPD